MKKINFIIILISSFIICNGMNSAHADKEQQEKKDLLASLLAVYTNASPCGNFKVQDTQDQVTKTEDTDSREQFYR